MSEIKPNQKRGRKGSGVFSQRNPSSTSEKPPMPIKAPLEIVRDEEKLARAMQILGDYTETFAVSPIRSNAELVARGREYFEFCTQKGLYPTIEGLASFCGYGIRQFQRWENGQAGFKDGKDSTAEIVERLKGIIDSFDGQLVLEGKINPVPYIFRKKALNKWVEASKLEIVTTDNSAAARPLTPEEIAARLPDPDEEYTIIE